MQSINSLLRFRTKIFPGKITEINAVVEGNEPVEVMLHFLHVLKEAKPLVRRASLTSADDDLIKAIVDCAINTLNENHKLTKENRSKLSTYENHLRALVNPQFSPNSKRKLLIQKGGFIFPLLTSILSVVIGTLISGNN